MTVFNVADALCTLQNNKSTKYLPQSSRLLQEHRNVDSVMLKGSLRRTEEEIWSVIVTICILIDLSVKVECWGLMSLFQDPSYKDVCYKPYGCFSIRPPFTNTNGRLPDSPQKAGVRFLLYNRNMTKPRRVRHCGKLEPRLKSLKDVKIIVHGYSDHHKGRRGWIKRLVRKILRFNDVHVIIVDWMRGAKSIDYLQAAANTRIVGAITAGFIGQLDDKYRIPPGRVHIIGHSLGAHIAGYAGERVKGLGRITGLDPAGPAFQGTPPEVRLDPTDAIVVDVIHTDTDHLISSDLHPGFGAQQPMGTIDYYPNGGNDQPGCPTSFGEHFNLLFTGHFDLVQNVGCSHLRVLHLFRESIGRRCQFRAYPCSMEELNTTSCNQCGERGCVNMGYNIDKQDSATGIYYVKTNDKHPFCIR